MSGDRMLQRVSATVSEFVVFVSGLQNGTIAVDVSKDVAALKKAIEAREGIPVSEQRLIFAGKELRSWQTLADCGVGPEATVHILFRARGGGAEASTLEPFKLLTNAWERIVLALMEQRAATAQNHAATATECDAAPGKEAASSTGDFSSRQGRDDAVASSRTAGAHSDDVLTALHGAPEAVQEDQSSPTVQEPDERKERDPDAVNAILIGDVAKLEKALQSPTPLRVIRTFVSSTFTDTSEERNRLLKDVVPELQELCAKHGYEFQASEMRWSIRGEESQRMETSAICMRELSNCQASSAGMNYLYIACDKYGFRPPPKTIPKAFFEQLLEAMDVEGKDLASQCYCLDTNFADTELDVFISSLPACGPTRETLKAWDAQDGPQFVLQIGTEDWVRFEKLVITLRAAAHKVWHKENTRDPTSCHWAKKFVLSVTEEEVCHGALWANPEPGRTRLKVFKRSFTPGDGKHNGIPLGDKMAPKFIDMANGAVDKDAQTLLGEQKTMVQSDCEWSVDWAPGKGIDPANEQHKAYLQQFCDAFKAACIESLNEALANEVKEDAVVDEAERHLRFAYERACKFHASPTAVAVLDRVTKYLDTGHEQKACVLWGKSGAGKTYVVAKTAVEAAARCRASNGVFVVRFLGTTNASSKVALLLESVLAQLMRVYEKDDYIPSDYDRLEGKFRDAVATWPSDEKPLTLILDSVDQLDDTNQGRSLHWLPTTGLPDCVRIVVSSLPDYPDEDGKQGFTCLSRLEHALSVEGWKDDACFLKVEDIEDPKEILEHLLLLQGRTITDTQMEKVLEAFRNRDEKDMAGTPLWITLAAHRVATLRSYDKPPHIPTSVRELIIAFFDRLATLRGRKLVRKALASITLCKDGISESELAHVLSLDDDVLDEQYEWWVPPVRVIPCIVVTRLLVDLLPYLATRGSGSSLGWYHRQFWEAAQGWLFQDEGYEFEQRVHAELADYFCGKHHGTEKEYTLALRSRVQKHWAYETAGDRNVPAQARVLRGNPFGLAQGHTVRFNERRLTEYVHHCTRAGLQDRATEELASPLYIACKFRAGMGTDLQLELVGAIKRFPQVQMELQRVKAFIGKFLEIVRHPLVPWDILQAAYNEPDAAAVRKELLHEMDADEARAEEDKTLVDFKEHLLEWKHRPQHFDLCQLSLYNPFGKSSCVASANDCIAFCSANVIKVCSVLTGEELCTLKSHTEEVTTIAFSPDGKRLASGSSDKTVRIWNPSTGQAMVSAMVEHQVSFRSMTFSPDGKRLAASCLRPLAAAANSRVRETVRIWDPETGTEMAVMHYGADNFALSVAFSPDGKCLILGNVDSTVQIWDPETGTESAFHPPFWPELQGEKPLRFTAVAISPDGATVASGIASYVVQGPGSEENCSLRLWDIASGTEKFTLAQPSAVSPVVFSQDGKLLAWGNDRGTVQIWDPSTGQETVSTHEHNGTNGVAFSSDGTLLASVGNAMVRIWNTTTGQRTVSAPVSGHTDAVFSIAFSPNGELVATGGRDSTVRIWDPTTGAETVPTLSHSDWVRSVVFSPNGDLLVSVEYDGLVRFWDASTGQEVVSPLLWCMKVINELVGLDTFPGTYTAHTSVSSVAFSPTGELLASASFEVRIWNPRTGTEHLSLLDSDTRGSDTRDSDTSDWDARCECIVFSPNGAFLASGWSDTTVHIWDTTTGQKAVPALTGHIDPVRFVVFSPDGATLATASSGNSTNPDGSGDPVRLWDVASGTEKLTLPLQRRLNRRQDQDLPDVLGLAFSNNGKLLAVRCIHGVEIYDPTTGNIEILLDGGHFCFCGSDYIAITDIRSRVLVYKLFSWTMVACFNTSTLCNRISCQGKHIVATSFSGDVIHIAAQFLR